MDPHLESALPWEDAQPAVEETPLRSFLLIFSSTFGERNALCEWFNSRAEILNWIAPPIPNVLIITSRHQASDLGAMIRQRYVRKQFLVVEVSHGSADGWIAKPIWDHLRQPHSSGRWQEPQGS